MVLGEEFTGGGVEEPFHGLFAGDADGLEGGGKGAEDDVPEGRGDAVVGVRAGEVMIKMVFSRPAPIKIPRCVGVEAAVEHLIRGVTYDKANAKRKAVGEVEEPDGEGGDDGEGDEGADDLFEGGGEVVNSRMML